MRQRATQRLRALLWSSTLCCSLTCFAGEKPPSLMLANVHESGTAIDLADYWVSEKLDGVRGYWDGEKLLTRSGNIVPAPAWFTAGWPEVPLDGELWAGRGRFAFASATVRTQTADNDAWRQMQFMVFDLPAHGGPFTDRLAALNALLEPAPVPWLRAVRQFRVRDAEALHATLKEVVEAGGEGLMLHRGTSVYRAGESDDLLKYKLHRQGTARVVAHVPGNGKYAHSLGSLLVEDPDGLEFRIGTGFTDEQRLDPPAIGRCVTYAYNGFTVSGIPRFPRFVKISPCRTGDSAAAPVMP